MQAFIITMVLLNIFAVCADILMLALTEGDTFEVKKTSVAIGFFLIRVPILVWGIIILT